MDIHIQSYKADIYKKTVINMGTKVYRVSQEERAKLREGVPYDKL